MAEELNEVKQAGFLVSNIVDLVLTIEDSPNLISSADAIIKNIEKLLDLVSQPFKSTLGNLKNQLVFIVTNIKKKNRKSSEDDLMDILTTIGNYISKESESILVNVKETVTLELDFDKDLKSIPTPRVILWDANFAKLISSNALKQSKSNYDIRITGQNIFLKTVIDELQHRREERIKLVSSSFLNYLRSFATFFEDYLPAAAEQEEKDIMTNWRLTTKGISGDTDYFRNTGDFEIILYCYRTADQRVIVLSNDTEIRDTVRSFKSNKRMINTNVYNIENDYSLRHAA